VIDRLDVNVTLLLVASGESVIANLVGVNNSDLSLITIEDLGDLLEGRALGLDVEEGDEYKFQEDPDLAIVSIYSWSG
jgi:hypothetical protein